MEWDVVLAHELIQLHLLWVPPPLLPVVSQVSSDGDVPDRGIEPHIEPLLLHTFLRDPYAPVEVSRHASWLETLVQPALADGSRVGGPGTCHRPLGDELFELGGEVVETEEEMVGRDVFWRVLADVAVGLKKVFWVEEFATSVALVSFGFLIAAMRAGSDYESVGEGDVAGFAHELLDLFSLEISALVYLLVQILDNLRVFLG